MTATNQTDVENTAFINSLNASQKATYVAENVDAVLNNITSEKEKRFKYAMDNVLGADNSISSSVYYLTRTKDLIDISNDMDDMTRKKLQEADVNSGIITRQQQINEWSNSNKLDTLYFLQILFICLTIICLLVFLKSMGLISLTLQIYLMVLVTAFAVFTLITRARYTSAVRDSRYWDKKRFSKEVPPPANVSLSCPSPQNISDAVTRVNQGAMNAYLSAQSTFTGTTSGLNYVATNTYPINSIVRYNDTIWKANVAIPANQPPGSYVGWVVQAQ